MPSGGGVGFCWKSEKGDAPFGSIAHVRKKVAIPMRRDSDRQDFIPHHGHDDIAWSVGACTQDKA